MWKQFDVRVRRRPATPRLESQLDLLATWNTVKRPIEPGGGGAAPVEPDITPVKAA